MKKRIISWILVFAMCLSMMPVNAFAEVPERDTEEEQTVMLEEAEPEEDPEPEPETEPVTEPEPEPETEPVTEPVTEPETQPESAPEAEEPDLDQAVSALQALIDALPEEVTEDNAEIVAAQLETILEGIETLTEDQLAQLDLTRYKSTLAALDAMTGGLYEADTLDGEPEVEIRRDDFSQKYDTLEAAIAEINTLPSGINFTGVLLSDVTLENTLNIEYCTITLDTNGKHIKGTLNIGSQGNLTLTGEGTVDEIRIELDNYDNGAELSVTGGKVGELYYDGKYPISVKLSGGSYSTIALGQYAGNYIGITVRELLDSNYAFWIDEGLYPWELISSLWLEHSDYGISVVPCSHDYNNYPYLSGRPGICIYCAALCQHPIHGTDGKCTTCGVDCSHSFDSKTGACTVCGKECDHQWNENGQCTADCEMRAVASVRKTGAGTQYYANLQGAVDAVKDCTEAENAVVTVLAKTGASSTLQVEGGVFTLNTGGFENTFMELRAVGSTITLTGGGRIVINNIDLNPNPESGKQSALTVQGVDVSAVAGDGTLKLDGGKIGTVTVKGSVELTDGTIQVLNFDKNTAFTMNGGTVEKLCVYDSEARLSGGTYQLIYCVPSGGATLRDLLEVGYAYQIGRDKQKLSALSGAEINCSGNDKITIVECTSHSWDSATGTCEFCKTSCQHTDGWTNGKCKTCGTPCTHASGFDANGKCTTCGRSAPTYVTKAGQSGKKYFATLKEALAEVKDCTAADQAVIDIFDVTLTEDLTITGGAFCITTSSTASWIKGGQITITGGDVTLNGQISIEETITVSGGVLTITAGGYQVVVKENGTLNGKSALFRSLAVENDNVTLSGGSYPEIKIGTGCTKDLLGLLADGYAYWDPQNKTYLAPASTEKTLTSSYPYYTAVKKCTHENGWENGTCKFCKTVCQHPDGYSSETGKCGICGAECDHQWKDGKCTNCHLVCVHQWKDGVCETCQMVCQHSTIVDGTCQDCGLTLVASVTQNGTTTGYFTLEEAIKNVADGATVKLLRNVTLKDTLTIDSGTFTLDLDDKMLSYSGTCNLAISGTADVTLKGRAGKLPSGSLWQGGIKNLGGGGRAVEVTGGKLTIAANTTEQIGSGSAQMGVLLYSYGKYSSDRALYVNGGQVTVNGGYFDCSKTAIEVRSGTLNFNNGQIGWYDYSSGSWVKNSCAISVWGGNVNISGGEIVANGTALSVNNNSAKVTLSGGSYDSIWVQDGRVDDLLADSCGYQDADGSWMGFAECASASIRNVKVVSGAPMGRVTVTPETASLTLGYTQGTQLTADVTTSVNPAYQWYEYTGDDASKAQPITGETKDTYTVPTGKAAGTYRYFCVVSVGDFARQSGVATVTVEAKAQEDLNKVGGGITMPDGTYGEKLGAPSFTKPEGTESTKITYAPKDGSEDFKETPPTEPGDYIVKIECETQDKIYVGTKDFTIHKAVYNGAKEVTVKVPSTGSTKNQVTLPDVPEGAGYGDVTSTAAFLDLSSVKRNDKTLNFTTIQVGAGTSGTMEVQVTGGENYQDYKITVTMEVVDKAQKPLEGTVTMPQWTYGDQPKDPTFTAPEGHDKTTYLYAPKGSADFKETVPTKAGDYTVKIICETNLEIYTATKDFTIEKREVSFDSVSVANREYAPNDVTVSIYGSLKNLVAGDKVSFTATVDTPDAGSNKPVTVTLTGEDADNYRLDATGVNANGNRVTISPKVVNEATILVASGTYVYDGTAKTLAVTVKDGSNVIPAGEYTVSYSDNVKPGRATVYIADNPGGNYHIHSYTLNFTITKREVTVSGIAAENKVYDGTTAAALDYSNVTFANMVEGEDLTVTATGTFDAANVGTGRTVTITGLTLGGADAENYVLAAEGQQTTATADITKRDITITGVTAVEREYKKDDTSVTLTGGTLQNLVTGDKVSFTLGAGTMADANAGTDKKVTTNITLTGEKAGNYVLTQPTDVTVTINPKSVKGNFTIDFPGNVQYDGTAQKPEIKIYETDWNAPGYYGDLIDPSEYTVTYSDNVKPGKAGYSIQNKAGSNYYMCDDPISGSFFITPREVTVSGIAAENKVYDGSTTATLDCSGVNIANVVAGETLTVTATGSFDTASVGAGKTVNITGLTLGGKDAENYVLAAEGQQTTATASITAREVTVSGITAEDKVYDGTTTAALDYSGVNIVNVVAGETLTVTATGTFENAAAGVNKTVTLTGLTLGGEDKDNYVLAADGQQTTAKASISAREVTVSGITAEDKTYDGGTDATVTGTATINGKVGNDDVTVKTGKAEFADKNVGTWDVTFSGFELEGEDKDNYRLITQPASVKASIGAKNVTIIGLRANGKIYDGNTTATVTGTANIDGKVGNDKVTVKTGKAAFAEKNAGTWDVTFSGFELEGSDAGNYHLTAQPAGVKADITAREVTVSGITAEDKTYDGTTAATLDCGKVTFGNIVAGDTLTVTATGAFENTAAGTNKTVTITGLTLGGKDKDNYVLAANGQQTTATASILATRNYLNLEGKPDFDDKTEIWIDGVSYPIQTDGGRYVLLPDDGDLMTTYTYETGDSTPGHENYPTGMRVYSLERLDTGAQEEHIGELDDLLMYEGCSIRVSGKWGIRMITSMTKDNKQALTKADLAGYTLEEYGTVVQWVDTLGGKDLTLDTGKYNFAYSKEKRKDPVFANVGSTTQYTNVLVDFSLEECSKDMVLRPYIILKDAGGNTVTLYGGCVTRSIGYIAYQNRSEFKAGSSAYKYVWEIIHAVYGDRYDSEYKGK